MRLEYDVLTCPVTPGVPQEDMSWQSVGRYGWGIKCRLRVVQVSCPSQCSIISEPLAKLREPSRMIPALVPEPG